MLTRLEGTGENSSLHSRYVPGGPCAGGGAGQGPIGWYSQVVIGQRDRGLRLTDRARIWGEEREG